MAHQGRRPAKGSGKGTPPRRNRAVPNARPRPGASKKAPAPATRKVVFDAAPAAAEEPRTFRLGAVPGATPGTWIDRWKQRLPDVPLELVPIEVAAQRSALDDLDAALVRLPLDDASLHVIPLYDEVPVVVAAADSHLMAADELTPDDLDGEVLIALSDDVWGGLALPGTTAARFAPLATSDAIATAASGVGVVIVPMSLARLHHRKDADHRVLAGGPVSTVALAWRRDRTTPDVEAFVGIVRGRTANSSR
ncbi:LysR family substrate-binding domain-containing protein [Microbacterium sp. SSW1-47]|uniref:LysR family substrate-binding domain-containing protein n=1 Tax=Microbacterium sufflavum TaxID=2851649 RepID=UPI001FFD76F2|nr:LysR family substrate-binding domain-containing protein [Microbacterium sufflavum]MCK2024976.1 LysR family substrate-binding domain-containing protein [Microbacterium sufflavum]